jgi:hypothetical protein
MPFVRVAPSVAPSPGQAVAAIAGSFLAMTEDANMHEVGPWLLGSLEYVWSLKIICPALQTGPAGDRSSAAFSCWFWSWHS